MNKDQQLFDFVDDKPRLAIREREGRYVVFLSVQTRVPDPDAEFTGGFGVDFIYGSKSLTLCVIQKSAGGHVVNEAVRLYGERYKEDHPDVKRLACGKHITQVNVSFTYPEKEFEVYEIPKCKTCGDSGACETELYEGLVDCPDCHKEE